MSDKLSITLLGAPQIVLNGRSLHFRSVKVEALLAYLATSGMLHDRAELAALLWAESDNKRARGALRYTLSLIKKELGDGYLIINRRQIGMDPEANWAVDVVQMRQLLGPALEPGNGLVDEAVPDIEKGVDLYQADFLQGFTLRDSDSFNEWAAIQGEALRRDLATALKRLVAYHQEQQHWDTAVTYAHRWLNLDPLNEPAHRQLMQLYAESGEWTAVHNQYQALTDLLEKELDVSPQPETTALYQQLCSEREAAAVSAIPQTELSPDQRSRHVLMAKMRRFWIDSQLVPLQQEQTFIKLKLEFVNELIDHPWADVLNTEQTSNAANIYHAFRNADRALLILGAPGAGKTISLIQLTQYLLSMAAEDENQPVPVILNLSGWAGKQMSIAAWAVEELVAKYQIPRRIGRRWLAEDKLLFLLDGLDEMPVESIADCIAAVNIYRKTYGLTDMVVCCRQAVFETAVTSQNSRLQLNGAVLIRPLTTAQIQQHAPLALAKTLFKDETLLEMAQSPLNLNMMQTVFNGSNGTSHESKPFTHSSFFDKYIQQMVQRQAEKESEPIASSDLSNQLSWLAQQMRRHNQSIFLIEQLQPSWFENKRWQWAYLLGTHVMLPAVLGTLIMWSFVQLIGINPPFIEINFLTEFAALFGITHSPVKQLFALFCLNFFAGLLSTIATGLFFLWRRRRGDENHIDYRLGWLQLLVTGVIVWAAVTLPLLTTDAFVLALFLGGMAAFGLILTFGGISYGQSFQTEIRVRGAVKWSWHSAFLLGAIGAAASLLWSGIIWLRDPTAVAASQNLLNIGLLFFLLGGLSDKRPETKNRPNEGMRIAGLNGLKAMLVVAIPALVLTAVTVNLASGLYTGIMLGVFAGTVHGFNDLFKHSIVRLLLWRKRQTPLNYQHLLDYAANCVLLQRVGGGYTFRHRLLQDHFANK